MDYQKLVLVIALSVATHTKETSNLKLDLKSVVTTRYN